MSGTSGIVVFDPIAFLQEFPEFGGVAPNVLASYFNRGCRMCDNTATSPVSDGSQGGERAGYLNLLTAHIAALAARGSAVVGRISNGSEGGVSTAFDAGPVTSPTQAWCNQTTYGAEFWIAISGYRRGFYVPPCLGQPAWPAGASIYGPQGWPTPYGR